MKDKLKEMRGRAGLKVQEVAEHIGVKRATVYAWEAGDKFPEPANLTAIMGLYGATDEERAEIARVRVFGPDAGTVA